MHDVRLRVKMEINNSVMIVRAVFISVNLALGIKANDKVKVSSLLLLFLFFWYIR